MNVVADITLVETSIHGMPVWLNPHLVEYVLVDRTWKERLLSLTPWKATREIKIPSTEMYQTESGLIMHPEQYRIVTDQLMKLDK